MTTREEGWAKDIAADEALKEFIAASYRLSPKQWLTLLDFFTWAGTWAPKTSPGRLLKVFLNHYGSTNVTEVASLLTGTDRIDSTTNPTYSEYFVLKRPTDEVARSYNRTVLSEGVNGARCLRVIPTPVKVATQLAKHLDGFGPKYYFGDCEVYDNGALNIFVRKRGDDIPIAVVRIRPEYTEAENATDTTAG